MTDSRHQPKQQIDSPDDVPRFSSDEEAAEFWKTHHLGPAMLDRMEHAPEEAFAGRRPRTKLISLRMDSELLVVLKGMAIERHTPYQTLLKELVVMGLAVTTSGAATTTGANELEFGWTASGQVAFPRVFEQPTTRRHTEAVRQRGRVLEFAR